MPNEGRSGGRRRRPRAPHPRVSLANTEAGPSWFCSRAHLETTTARESARRPPRRGHGGLLFTFRVQRRKTKRKKEKQRGSVVVGRKEERRWDLRGGIAWRRGEEGAGQVGAGACCSCLPLPRFSSEKPREQVGMTTGEDRARKSGLGWREGPWWAGSLVGFRGRWAVSGLPPPSAFLFIYFCFFIIIFLYK